MVLSSVLKSYLAAMSPHTVCICKYPKAQFTSTGNGRPISSTGTSTGSAKSHFRHCVDRSFSSFSGLGACSVTSGVTTLPSGQIYQNRERSASAHFFRALFYSTKTLPLSSFERCSIQQKLREALHIFRKALLLSSLEHCYICTKMKSSPCN